MKLATREFEYGGAGHLVKCPVCGGTEFKFVSDHLRVDNNCLNKIYSFVCRNKSCSYIMIFLFPPTEIECNGTSYTLVTDGGDPVIRWKVEE